MNFSINFPYETYLNIRNSTVGFPDLFATSIPMKIDCISEHNLFLYRRSSELGHVQYMYMEIFVSSNVGSY
jgi:hypothetical protein